MPTSLNEIVAQEMRSLREELRDLKGYQFRLISIAAVITGFLLSLARFRLESITPIIPTPSLYLLPLVVVVPSWWIFFDKAKTITRIVGYYRNLEVFLREEPDPKQFLGWERALGIFRKRSRSIALNLRETQPWPKRVRSWVWHFFATASLWEGQRYWMLAYYTFLTLSFVCIGIPLWSRHFRMQELLFLFHVRSWNPEAFLFVFAVGVTCYCALFNAVILSRLIWGQHSYDSLEKIWKQALSG